MFALRKRTRDLNIAKKEGDTEMKDLTGKEEDKKDGGGEEEEE